MKPAPVDYGTDQFPGVYFTLITKDNLLTEQLLSSSYCLIFSKNLLYQRNYHINITDNNGFITENNTYFPWNLKEAVEEIKKNTLISPFETDINYHLMNEVIFHDPVPMEYCCMEIDRSSLSCLLEFDNHFLPNYPIDNNILPNTDLLPFYCYAYYEDKNRINSSYTFFQKLARICNIEPTLTTEEIIKQIQAKMDFLYEHRDKQNFSYSLF